MAKKRQKEIFKRDYTAAETITKNRIEEGGEATATNAGEDASDE